MTVTTDRLRGALCGAMGEWVPPADPACTILAMHWHPTPTT